MRILGVRTSDFSVYYDLVQALRARQIPFSPLAEGEPIPPHVGVVITTDREVFDVPHPRLVTFTEAEESIAEALRLLEAPGPYRVCVVGVDPGERPGLAVLADGRVLRMRQAESPEGVLAFVQKAMREIPAERFVVRVGHGAPTYRDRILQTLVGLAVPLELVDETRSTPQMPRTAERDTVAAAHIALVPGELLRASDLGPVRPTDGELRDIQRKSRLASEGALTISRALARNVALGHLTLDQAVDQMRGRA